MEKKVFYKEPKEYFPADVAKFAREWDKKQAEKKKAAEKQTKAKKK